MPPATISAARISAGQARRIALAAQGFADPPPAGAPDRRHLKRVLDRVGLIQIDSVNVLTRSHYLPPLARLGPYPQALLEGAAWGRKRTLFEYWGHEASLIPLEQQPLFRWRMARAAAGEGTYTGLARFGRERAPFIAEILAEVARRGPTGAGALERGRQDDARKGQAGWWAWSDAKRAVEWLFWAGKLTTARRDGFERLYDLPERVFPDVAALPTPAEADAQRSLVRIAARALGVATEGDLRDYHRLDVADARARIAELAEAGELLPVQVDGWRQPAWLLPDAARPRRVRAAALLSPFDSLIWRRERAERLFGLRYRLEIYTPAEKRVHGYYVLPFLLDEAIVARLDLKADRAARTLRVQAAHLEAGAQVEAVAGPLAASLARMAGWLGLDGVTVTCRGHERLCEALTAELVRAAPEAGADSGSGGPGGVDTAP